MLKIGHTLPIYQKWQTNEKELGTAVLISKVRDGETFIIEDQYTDPFMDGESLRIPESLTPVYNYQRWVIEFTHLTPLGEHSLKIGDKRQHNIRYLDTIGISKSSIPQEDPVYTKMLEDRFLSINGIEVF